MLPPSLPCAPGPGGGWSPRSCAQGAPAIDPTLHPPFFSPADGEGLAVGPGLLGPRPIGSSSSPTMAHSRDLYKTKLCTLYQKGNCPRQSCSFAHGDAELRKFHGGSAGGVYGRHDTYRNADLRERLDRRRSPPIRRRSPGRDGRGHQLHGDKRSSRDRGRSRSRSPARRRQSSRSVSAARSPSHRSDKREPKRLRIDADDAHFSDVSGEVGGNDGDMEDSAAKSKRSMSPSPRGKLEEQIRLVEADSKTLRDQKAQLELALEQKDLEASRLSAKNQELESMLASLQEDYKRLGTKMKRFLRVYMRYVRAQEDVKKTQAKLQRLADELPLDDENRLPFHGEDSDVNFVSDGEPERPSKFTNHIAPDFDGQPSSAVALLNGASELQAGKDVLTVIPSLGKESQGDSDIHLLPRDGNTKKPSTHREKSRAAKINRSCLEQNGINLKGDDGDEGDWKRQPSLVRLGLSDVMERSSAELAVIRGRQSGTETSPSSKNLPTDKVRGRDSSFSLPSTGLAARAQDHPLDLKDDSAQGQGDYSFHERNKLNVDLTLGSTSQFNLSGRSLPLSAAVASSHYVQYKGEDEDVDVEAVEADGDEQVCTDLGMAGNVEMNSVGGASQ